MRTTLAAAPATAHTVLYWSDPADDHFAPCDEFERRFARAVTAAALVIDWSHNAFREEPYVWVHCGSVSHPKVARRFARTTVECICFSLPDPDSAAAVREALLGHATAWRLGVSASEARILPLLAVHGALVSGGYVRVSGYPNDVEAARWKALLRMPVVTHEDGLEMASMPAAK